MLSILKDQFSNEQISSLLNNKLINAVRVKSIILNQNHPRFKELGEWNSLGSIEYDSVQAPSSGKQNFPIAKPLLPNIKNYPLINEIVYVMSLPDYGLSDSTNSSQVYYLNIIGIWNHPHHNGYPEYPNENPLSQNQNYNQTQIGNNKKTNNNPTEIKLGNTFEEKSNIHPLLPFEGDVIYEGRWGNSLRFGSTVLKNNFWSNSGKNGDPIIILKNGQGSQNNEGWVPVLEDINKDESSIYLTSTQKIPIIPASSNYSNYKSPFPENPKEYNKNQIIIASGRLLFNSKTDHILLSSNKGIDLNSIEDSNIYSNNIILSCKNKIYLGDKNANQAALLGNKTIDFLSSLLKSLNKVAISLSTISEILPQVPQAQVNIASSELTVNINKLLGDLNSLLSKEIFIKDNGIKISMNEPIDENTINNIINS